MARRKTPQQLRTRGFAWGQRRVELGVSQNELARLTGLQKADLSRIESGRMVPTGDEFRRVMAILDGIAVSRDPSGGAFVPLAPPEGSPT